MIEINHDLYNNAKDFFKPSLLNAFKYSEVVKKGKEFIDSL
jgi:hypothetical protein